MQSSDDLNKELDKAIAKLEAKPPQERTWQDHRELRFAKLRQAASQAIYRDPQVKP